MNCFMCHDLNCFMCHDLNWNANIFYPLAYCAVYECKDGPWPTTWDITRFNNIQWFLWITARGTLLCVNKWVAGNVNRKCAFAHLFHGGSWEQGRSQQHRSGHAPLGGVSVAACETSSLRRSQTLWWRTACKHSHHITQSAESYKHACVEYPFNLWNSQVILAHI